MYLMAKVTKIKRWQKDGEVRIYAETDDGREGCRYLTGNKYHAAKSVDGKLTEAEWSQARQRACVNGKWTSWYASNAITQNSFAGSQNTEDTRNDIDAMRQHEQFLSRQNANNSFRADYLEGD